jgi:hypothetical protein
MAINEQSGHDLAFYTIESRKIKDDYTLRKSQHDRRKLRKWLNALMLETDVLFWYKEDGEEKMIMGTLLDTDIYPIGDAPITIEEYRGRQYLEFYYIRFISMPGKEPSRLHLDSITNFLACTNKISIASDKTQ